MVTTAPILLSARLRLRPHVQGDFPACKALWQHPETIQFIGGAGQSDPEVWFRLLRYGGMWPMQGYGFWVFEDRATGEFRGEGGLMNAMRDVAGLQGIPEAGWALMPQAGGRGLATEIATACVQLAIGTLHLPSVVALTLPTNLASQRVLSKAGLAFERDIIHDGLLHVLFRT